MTTADVSVVSDVTITALELVAAALADAVATRGRALLCLSGGSTPLPLYRALATRHELPWSHTVFTWGDERYVPHTHPDSNYGAALRALVDHVPVSPADVLPWPEGPTPEAAARRYGDDLARVVGDTTPFDVTILGLGPDGHTASLFPLTGAATREEETFALDVPGVGWRLTMGARRLSRSRLTLFVVSGPGKRDALAATFGAAARGAGARSAAALDAHPARAIGALERLVVVTDVAVS